MSAAREYVSVLAGLVGGAVACIVLAGATWATAEETDVLGTDQVQIAGAELVPVAEAVGWLGLAAVLAVHATRGLGRAVVGALLAAAGLAVAGWAGWRAVQLDVVAEATGAGDTVTAVVSTTAVAAFGTAGAGAVIGAAGVLTVVRGARWPVLGRRYERPDRADAGGARTARDASRSAARDASRSAARDASRSAARDASRSAARDASRSAARDPSKFAARDPSKFAARDAWDALDRGEDPTTWLRGAERTRQNEPNATNGPGRRTRP